MTDVQWLFETALLQFRDVGRAVGVGRADTDAQSRLLDAFGRTRR